GHVPLLLGSVTAMSDEQGHVAASGPDATVLGYDAWGARRNPDATTATPASFNLPVGHRQFTGHEAIPNVGLVNMNGRVYDPEMGRFLSADPTIQFVANLQSYNRYSYVLNNPLRYTDPTGYGLFSAFGVHGWLDTVLTIGVAVVGAVICGVSAGAGCVAFTIFATELSAFSTAAAVGDAGGSGWQIGASVGIGIVAGLAGGAAGGAVGGSVGGAIIGG